MKVSAEFEFCCEPKGRNMKEYGHVTFNDEEMSMQDWLKRMTGWKSVETYKFAIHKATGKTLSEIRKEYMDENME